MVLVVVATPTACAVVPMCVATDNFTALTFIGRDCVFDCWLIFISTHPPWVQVGNGADPDERSGSFTENLQIWNHRHDAVRRNFQQN